MERALNKQGVRREFTNSNFDVPRYTLRQELSQSDEHLPPPAPNSPAEQELVAACTRAYSTADVQGLVAMLTEDVRVSMPPWPFQYRGRGTCDTVPYGGDFPRRTHLPTDTNPGQRPTRL